MLIGLKYGMTTGGEQKLTYPGLCFVAEEAGSTVGIKNTGPNVYVDISFDGNTWTPYTLGTTLTLAKAKDKVYFAAREGYTNGYFATSDQSFKQFYGTGRIAAYGDILSLIKNDLSITTVTQARGFVRLFMDCSFLTRLPAIGITDFNATDIGNSLFWNCTNARYAGKLGLIYGRNYSAYNQLYKNCSNLLVCPNVTTTTATYGYDFSSLCRDCSELVIGPKLNISGTGSNSIISEAFLNDNKLRWVWLTGRNSSVFNSYSSNNWMSGPATAGLDGTFICPRGMGTNATITRGVYGVPSSWTVVNEEDIDFTAKTTCKAENLTITLDVDLKSGASQAIIYWCDGSKSTITRSQSVTHTIAYEGEFYNVVVGASDVRLVSKSSKMDVIIDSGVFD